MKEIKIHVEIGENLRSVLSDFVGKVTMSTYSSDDTIQKCFNAVSKAIIGSIREAVKDGIRDDK